MSNHSSYTGRYTRSGYPNPSSPLTDAEIATLRTMRAAGCGLKSIAAALGRAKSAVARHIPPDAHDGWDAVPPTRTTSDDASLYARWQARMPELREAMRKAGAQP
jgi:IS30 family transposase